MGVEAQMRLSSTLFNHILETSSPDKDSVPFQQITGFITENKFFLWRDKTSPMANFACCPQSSPCAFWGRGSLLFVAAL